jgi:flagellar hook assembly protein FlgD
MATVNNSTSTNSTGSSNSTKQNTSPNDALRGLDMSQFLKLMIAQLQNQDPLQPLDNAQILQQISQIRQIGESEKLTNTLDSVLLNQNLSSASSMLGKNVKALTDDGQAVNGVVDRVTVTGGTPRLHVGELEVGLNNLSEIDPN